MKTSPRHVRAASAVFPRSTHLSPLGRSLRLIAMGDARRVALLHWAFPWSDLGVLWRYMVYGAMALVVLCSSISSQVDIKRTLKQIDRNESMQREALILNKRLLLEQDTRLRTVRLEKMAQRLQLSQAAQMVHLR